MIGVIIFLSCIIFSIYGIVSIPILIHSKTIKAAWRLLGMSILPALIIGLFIKDPWFAVDQIWRWLRLAVLLSWIPALIYLEQKGHLSYDSAFPKLLSRISTYSLLAVFTVWAINKTEAWGLVQANFNDDARAWFAETNRSEDGFIFTRFGNSNLLSEKLLDSNLDIYTYSIQWIGNEQIQLKSPTDNIVRIYSPKTHMMEDIEQSGERTRVNKTTGYREIWNSQNKKWEPRT